MVERAGEAELFYSSVEFYEALMKKKKKIGLGLVDRQSVGGGSVATLAICCFC